MKKTKLILNYAGYCFSKENLAIRTGKRKDIVFQSLWGLIDHPEKGYILYDTGYTHRFMEETKRYPNKIYAQITRVQFEPEDEIQYQLRQQGIDPLDIRHLILTHFHGDHTAGLRDFPNATIYCHSEAYKQVKKIPKLWGFSKGILKGLHPEDIEERAVFVDQQCAKRYDSVLGTSYDLFDDSSILLVDLPGHATGQIGVLLETEKNEVFLIADTCWIRDSFINLTLPSPMVKLILSSWKDFKTSLNKVHEYYKTHPETIIVPTHCQETTDALVSPEFNWNAL